MRGSQAGPRHVGSRRVAPFVWDARDGHSSEGRASEPALFPPAAFPAPRPEARAAASSPSALRADAKMKSWRSPKVGTHRAASTRLCASGLAPSALLYPLQTAQLSCARTPDGVA